MGKNMRRKKLNLKKLRERKGKRSGRLKKDSKGNGKRGMIKIGMIGEGLTEVLGELVNLVKDQPVTTKMMAGLLSSVKGHTNWELLGNLIFRSSYPGYLISFN